MKKRLFGIAAALLALAMIFSGCSKAYAPKYDYEAEGYYYSDEYLPNVAPTSDARIDGFEDYSKNAQYDGEAPQQQNDPEPDTVSSGRKLIRTIAVTAETTEFDAALELLKNKMTEFGGYFEKSSVSKQNNYRYDRYAYLIVRVPQDKADDFIKATDGKMTVTAQSEDTKDVTLSYSDVESRLKALYAQEGRLLELLEQAKNLNEVIQLEDKLTDVRYEIESYESAKRSYDNKIEFTTVTIHLYEVKEIKPVEPEPERSYWEETWEGLKENLEGVGEFFKDFFQWFIGALPVLAVLGGVGFGIFAIIRGSIRRGKKKRAAKRAAEQAEKDVVNVDAQ